MVDYAQLAQSLKDNEAFQAALGAIRAGALEALATLPRSDEMGFYNAQATVRVVDEIKDDLEAFLRAGAPVKKPGLA